MGAAEQPGPNVDTAEVDKFDSVAHDWWNPDGHFRPLHDLNPVRLGFVQQHVSLADCAALDVGCGGGLLSEAMAACGAKVTGIDLSAAALAVAREHADGGSLAVDYLETTVESHADTVSERYDVVTCMEMLEHVPDPTSVLLASARCLRPGGYLFASTLNRTPKSFLLGIVTAEYVLGLLPKGTHRYASFIRPSEMRRWGRSANLQMCSAAGLAYDPFQRSAKLVDDVSVNYVMAFRKPQ